MNQMNIMTGVNKTKLNKEQESTEPNKPMTSNMGTK